MKYAKLCNDTRFRYPDAWLILAASEVLPAYKSKINHCPIVIHSGHSDHSVECWSWFQSSHSFLIPFASAGLFPFPFAGPFAGPFPGPFAGPLAAGACHSSFNRISRIPSQVTNTKIERLSRQQEQTEICHSLPFMSSANLAPQTDNIPCLCGFFGFFRNFCFYFASFFCFWVCCWHFCCFWFFCRRSSLHVKTTSTHYQEWIMPSEDRFCSGDHEKSTHINV